MFKSTIVLFEMGHLADALAEEEEYDQAAFRRHLFCSSKCLPPVLAGVPACAGQSTPDRRALSPVRGQGLSLNPANPIFA
jgi:hypothetical protein